MSLWCFFRTSGEAILGNDTFQIISLIQFVRASGEAISKSLHRILKKTKGELGSEWTIQQIAYVESWMFGKSQPPTEERNNKWVA